MSPEAMKRNILRHFVWHSFKQGPGNPEPQDSGTRTYVFLKNFNFRIEVA